MSNRVELQIGSTIYPYWDEVTVSKRIDAVANSFDLSIFGLDSGELKELPIREGDKAGLKLGNQQIIAGYIDARSVSFSKSEHSINISGRDNTGDLVDCSLTSGNGQFKSQTLTQIASTLCAEFDIPVVSQASDIIPSFKIDPGESIYESLERYSRLYGYLLRPDGLGNLTLARIGETYAVGALKQGKNILSGSADYENTERFSEYLVLGQNQNPEQNEEEAEEVSGSAKDLGIDRHRPKSIVASNSVSFSQAKALAEWEASVRAARSLKVSIETQGWEQSPGILWDVNELIRVESPILGISAYMLSTGVDFSFSSEEGTKTTIELTRLDAFKPSPVLNTNA